MKEMVRGLGYDPDKILVKDAISEPHRIVASSNAGEREIRTLTGIIREALVKDVEGASSGMFESSIESPPGYHTPTRGIPRTRLR